MQVSIFDPSMYDVISIESTGSFVGGERKLSTEKENYDETATKNMLDAVISLETVFPAHKRPDFTFYIIIKITADWLLQLIDEAIGK